MKRKDKFTKDEILELFTHDRSRCAYCTQQKGSCDEICIFNVKDWFEEEILIKPRIAFINTIEELMESYSGWKKYCSKEMEDRTTDCSDCPYFREGTDCFVNWLSEEVEV